MSGGGEYEPKDSRIAEGGKGDPKKSWREQEHSHPGGEYEPKDSRNVEGGASSPDDPRWENKDAKPPRGVPQEKPMDAEDAARAGTTAEPDPSSAAQADAHWHERDAKRPNPRGNPAERAATRLPPD
jgi:hypothetical protein